MLDQRTSRSIGIARNMLTRPTYARTPTRLANVAFLVDGAEYFRRLEQSIQLARRMIFIIGWDFDARIVLSPDREHRQTLGELLRSRVEQNPELEIRILVWSLGVVHAPGEALPLIMGAPWQDHPRIHIRLDNQRPVYAAQHQKIICIDDAIAFTGGMDLTIDRWDTPSHTANDLRRRTPDGIPYPPVHDIQIAVDGDAAQAIGDIARQRWKQVTGESLPLPDPPERVWPNDLRSDFEQTRITVACTHGGWRDTPQHSAVSLTLDAIACAQRTIYIETQYLTARRVERRLAALLRKQRGPEIIIVVTRASPGVIETYVMGENRDRLLRRLRKHDPHGRLRVYYPVVPADDGECDVKIHSKLIIADDKLIKIGSSNLNNRSMGLDRECDIAIEAQDDTARSAIRRLRNSLIAEHLDSTAQCVADAIDHEDGSLIAAIERLNTKPRGLRAMDAMWNDGPTRPLPFTWLLDPFRPLNLKSSLMNWWQHLAGVRR